MSLLRLLIKFVYTNKNVKLVAACEKKTQPLCSKTTENIHIILMKNIIAENVAVFIYFKNMTLYIKNIYYEDLNAKRHGHSKTTEKKL